MNTLELIHGIALVLHVIFVLALIALLVIGLRKEVKVIPKGLTHAGWSALVAGLVLLGLNHPLNNHNATKYPLYDNAKFGIKFLFLAVILGIAVKNAKKTAISANLYLAMLALAISNLIIAVTW